MASLAGGLAGEASLLLARGAQGVAAATMQPAILALVNTTFPAGVERTRALAVWGTVGASGLAAGVVIGGLLTTVSWRWTFFINLPFALVCMLAAPKVLPKARDGRPVVRLNVLSAVLCTGMVLLATIGLTLAADSGWGHPVTLGSFAVTAVLLVLFLFREGRSAQPLVDPALRSTRTLLAGCGSSARYMASVAATEFYLVTLLLQQERGYEPLEAGIAFLPLPVCITLGNMIAGRLLGPLGVRRTLTLAFLIGATGLALLGFLIGADGYLVSMVPGLVVSGIGHGMIYTSMFVGGTRDVADDNQGVAGALMTTTQYAGGALGVACLVLVLGTRPDQDSYMLGFLLAAAVAVGGALLAWTGFARADAAQSAADTEAVETATEKGGAGCCSSKRPKPGKCPADSGAP